MTSFAEPTGEKIPLSFEVRGGSPTLIETTMPDGTVYRLTLVPAVMSVHWVKGAENPREPGKPVLGLEVQIVTLTEPVVR